MMMITAEEHLMDASAMLSVCMATINSHLDDDMTPQMREDLYFTLRGAQRLIEHVHDGLPPDGPSGPATETA